jgi:hypothetical protein
MTSESPQGGESAMSDPPDLIDNLRAEYAELASNLRAGVSVLWDAFRTYFTISALLFGGAGFLLSDKSSLGETLSLGGAVGISIAGILITVLGVFGIRRIVAYQQAFLDRGCTIEKTLGTELMRTSRDAWGKASLSSAVALTFAVFLLFGASWILIGVYSWQCLRAGGGCLV